MGRRNRDSRKDVLHELKILRLESQYILTLLFVVSNKYQYKVNTETQHKY
jgi:hypothetical protein